MALEPTSQFHSEEERKVVLTAVERETILRTDPSFRSIVKAEYFDNYDLPCPIRVTVETTDGKSVDVVLRQNHHGDVEKEIRMFRALEECGLPVPKILAGPFRNDGGESEAVYSLLPGENLLKLGMRSDRDLQVAKELLVEAVLTLMDVTTLIEKHEVAGSMPRITLTSELEQLNGIGNPWLHEEVYASAMTYLRDTLKNIDTPLVISNGDYQPGNFLASNGVITGYLDFESASFQDPLMGFVKFPIYDMLPLGRTDIIDIFLRKKGFSKEDFRIRLALGCLKILQKEIPVAGGDEETVLYRERVLGLLRESVSH